MVQVAILGYGTVGSGVYEVLRTNRDSIKEKAGEEICVKYVLDLREFPGDPVEEVLVHDYEMIVNDPEVDIVVEVMGGIEPAHTFAKRALEAGKSVATSNKAMVAECGVELCKIAREKKINFLFEASCGGGIPIIRPLNNALTAEVIDEITGILNGTTNYMMYKMSTEGCDFEEVLKEAQAKGYAEADPTADIEGHDVCRKIAILSSIAYGKFVDFHEISTERITKISAPDMKYAKKLGMTIKLLGTSKRTDDQVYALVAPYLVGPSSQLYSVNDVFNGIFVHGNMLGDAMFYGSGAGKLPTASAVVADVIEEAKNLHKNVMYGLSQEKMELMSADNIKGRYFVRYQGSASEAESTFGKLEQVVDGVAEGEIGFITGEMTYGDYQKKAGELGEIAQMIRVKD
ncbi:MAG: homoserine dehydrogenase [Blautia sp.]